MLDLHRLADQLPQFRALRLDRFVEAQARIETALSLLRDPSVDWAAASRRLDARARPVLAARVRPGVPLGVGVAAPPRPTPVTVVATDGSQVFPDRHREPHCYLLNVSRIAFQYGTHEAPLIESVPTLGYEQAYVQEVLDAVERDPSADTVSALRDQLELDALLDTAREASVPGRPLVALADGTLIRWMLRRLPNPAHADAFLASYARALEGFRARRLPLASYISMPASTEVVTLLRAALDDDPGEASQGSEGAAMAGTGGAEGPAGEEGAADAAGDGPLGGVVDRFVFARLLRPGERSAVFDAGSRVQGAYADDDRICFFYLHVPGTDDAGDEGEVARVEVPRWVADAPALVDLVHSVVLDECRKHDGYPMILAEAHERAVIRAREKEAFYQILDHDFRAAGLPVPLSRKAASKLSPRG